MEQRICKITGRPFHVTEFEVDLLRKVGAANNFLSEPLPLPDVYPTAVLRQMSPFGNQFYIYRDKSALSGKSQLSRYNPAFGYQITTSEEFWSEEVDNTAFGRPYDFMRPFFEQWDELMHRCYLLPLLNAQIENCEFANGCFNCKSCYLCFDTLESEDCLYCFACQKGLANFDCCHAGECRYCYSCSDVTNCYECQHCRDCYNCSNCFACRDCRSCTDCFGCIGLNNGKYLLFNEQLSKEEYARRLQGFRLEAPDSRAAMLAEAGQIQAARGHATNTCINCENCTGSYLRNSNNLFHCYNTLNSKDCAFLLGGVQSRDHYSGCAYNSELGYCSLNSSSYNCHFSYCASHCNNCWYSYYLFNNCSDCFGCASLKKKNYCILNFQYGKKEYDALLPRIVEHMKSTGEWCEWFPVQVSTNTYQESWAHEYLEDIPEEEIHRRGYKIGTVTHQAADANAVDVEKLPQPIAAEMVLGKSIRCRVSGQAFSFQAAELEFYRKYSIPVPPVHWRERLKALLSQRERMPEVIR